MLDTNPQSYNALADYAPEHITGLTREQAGKLVLKVGDPRSHLLYQACKPVGTDYGDIPNRVHQHLRDSALVGTEKLEALLYRLQFSSPVTYTPAEDWAVGDLEKLEQQMIALMLRLGGIGLACSQIGLPLRGFVMGTTHYPNLPPFAPRLMLNPYRLESSGQQWGMEGCLSIPGQRGEILRPSEGVLVYQDIHGATHTTALKNILFRIAMHEYDHNHGKLYRDQIFRHGGIILTEAEYAAFRDHGIKPDYFKARVKPGETPEHMF